MLSSARRGIGAFASLRAASAISVRPNVSRLIPAVRPTYSYHIVRSTQAFSSISRHLEQTAPALDESQDSPQEFTKFEELGQNGIIHQNVVDTITKKMDIHTMTDVQRMTLNTCLDGTDVIAQAKTGTGKTLAFLLPIIQRILRDESLARPSRSRAKVDIRALIVSPTRELAEQIAAEARKIVANTSLQVQTAVGGTEKRSNQQKMSREGCHLLVGTPGRINDLLSDPLSGVTMDNIETFVLDEADRLLDIGFADAIAEMQQQMPDRSIKDRQTLMFSATVPKSVVALVRRTMRPNFKFVRTVDPDEAQTHERIPQRVVFMHGLANQLPTILSIAAQAVKAHEEDPVNNMPFKCIVYFGATTQAELAYEVFANLRDPEKRQTVRSQYESHPLKPARVYRMNGRLSQRQRTFETEGFRRAESALLFSTDVTARGMDFPNVSHVIQIGLPRQPDDYIHRLGRTGRAGKSGEGWLLLNEDERSSFRNLFRHQGINMEPREFESASLDMSQGGQIAANTAKQLQMIEQGVKSVPYDKKAAVYQSLLGMMSQQFPGRSKQAQVDMMNDLARYGWALETPPKVPRMLVDKLGFSRVTGLEVSDYSPRPARDSRDGRSSRFGSGRSGRDFDDKDPFGVGRSSGTGVFGSSERDSRGSRDSYGGRDDSRGGSRGSSFGDRRRGSFGGDRERGGFSRGGSSRGGFSRGGSFGGARDDAF